MLVDSKELIVNLLWVSLIMLILFIIVYRFILLRFKKEQIEKKLYFVLHSIELEPAYGTVPIFIEMHHSIEVKITIFSIEKGVNQVVEHKELKKGGNIIQLDTTKFENGFYFYQAESENQKTKKRFEIRN